MQLTRKTGSPDCDHSAEFQAVIDAEFPKLEGRQVPQNLVCVEGGDFTHGEKAIKLASRFGVKLMPWQREQVLLALETDGEGRWAHPDVVLICPRQNGKSLILEVVILYRLFVLNHQIIFTAQQWPTAKSIRNRLWRRIKSRTWAERRLVRNTNSAGEAEMETAEGGRIQFKTRSNDAGRGFDRIDLLLLDEAYNLDSGELDALAPIQLAAEDPQTYYTSSAVNIDVHAKGVELSKLRSRAMAETSEGILYSEFCAPEGANIDDPATWALANPSYGIIADYKKVRSMRNKLTDEGFEVEMLGLGRWFDPSEVDDDEVVPAVSSEALDLVMTGAHCEVRKAVLAIDASPDRSSCSISAGGRSGGKTWGALMWHGPLRVDLVAEAILELCGRVDPVELVIDPKSPAEVVIQALLDRDFDEDSIHRMKWENVKSSTAAFLAGVDSGQIVVAESQILREGFECATLREDRDGGVAWNRQSGVISQVVSLSHAMWAVSKLEEVKVDRRPSATIKPVRRRRVVAQQF